MGYPGRELGAGGEEADEDAGHSCEVEDKKDISCDFHIWSLDLYLFVIWWSWI